MDEVEVAVEVGKWESVRRRGMFWTTVGGWWEERNCGRSDYGRFYFPRLMRGGGGEGAVVGGGWGTASWGKGSFKGSGSGADSLAEGSYGHGGQARERAREEKKGRKISMEERNNKTEEPNTRNNSREGAADGFDK